MVLNRVTSLVIKIINCDEHSHTDRDIIRGPQRQCSKTGCHKFLQLRAAMLSYPFTEHTKCQSGSFEKSKCRASPGAFGIWHNGLGPEIDVGERRCKVGVGKVEPNFGVLKVIKA